MPETPPEPLGLSGCFNYSLHQDTAPPETPKEAGRAHRPALQAQGKAPGRVLLTPLPSHPFTSIMGSFME